MGWRREEGGGQRRPRAQGSPTGRGHRRHCKHGRLRWSAELCAYVCMRMRGVGCGVGARACVCVWACVGGGRGVSSRTIFFRAIIMFFSNSASFFFLRSA